MQVTVPVGGTNVIPEGEGPSRNGDANPPGLGQRKSLHTVRIAAPAAPQYQPEWTDNMKLKWVPVAQPEPEPAVEEQHVDSPVPRGNGLPDNGGQQSYDALQREISELKQAMQFMAQSQQPPQQPQGPTPPDPAEFDFYDPHQVKEFHRLNNEYIQATVQQTVQGALDPHRDAMVAAEYTRQYNSVLADHGHDPNFKPFMDKALQQVARSNGKLTIPEAYEWVASVQVSPYQPAAPSPSAKPGQRTLTAEEAAQKAAQARGLPGRSGVGGAGEPVLPASLMNVGALGRIMLHNQQTGRARPI